MDCHACRQSAASSLPPRESITRTGHWRVAHAFDSSLPGWLVMSPTTHVTALDQLPPAAHAELDTLLGSLSAALRSVTGCTKTYFMQFSEAPGYSHLHVHLVPRMPDALADRIGPQVFGHLSSGEPLPAGEMDRIASELRSVLEQPTDVTRP